MINQTILLPTSIRLASSKALLCSSWEEDVFSLSQVHCKATLLPNGISIGISLSIPVEVDPRS